MKPLLFFKKNILEISQSKTLIFYGFILCLTHLWTVLFWTKGFSANKLQSVYNSSYEICWPWFESCRLLPHSEILFDYIFSVYFGFVICGLFFFLFFKKFSSWAWAVLLVLTLFKFFLLFQDYRFMGNYHYMVFWVSLAYLLLPEKIKAISFFIVLFYFFAGTLKLNTEWLTSVTFLRPLGWDQKLIEIACGFIVYLELVLSFFLLSRKFIFRISVLFIYIVFHLVSIKVVGYFYPSIMSCLLMIFVLPVLFRERLEENRLRSKFSLSMILLFILFQLVPYSFSGDSALTSQGRMFSLNMLDSMSECEEFFYLKYKKEIVEVPRLSEAKYAVRIQCDPLVVFAEARKYCEDEKQNPEFVDMDIALISSRTSDPQFQKIFSYQNFCSRKLRISFLGGIP